ncbi:MAG: glycosyltransferase family 9 protein [Chlamydiales bacterium]|nr:glycosyltransferase family 9 protein [Chlamydiales bacterium]
MRILIIKTSALGDIVQTYPLLSYLKERFPEGIVDWVVEGRMSELVTTHSQIDKVISIDTRRIRKKIFSYAIWKEIFSFRKNLRSRTYDITFDVQGNCKSGLILWMTKSSVKVGFGRKNCTEWPALLFSNKRFNVPKQANIRDDYVNIARCYFQDDKPYFAPSILLNWKDKTEVFDCKILEKNQKMRVMICPGSLWSNKQLTVDALYEFLKCMDKKFAPYFLFVWGCKKEQEIAFCLHESFLETSTVVDKMPLPALQNLMDKMDLVISMDSLPLHLAATTKAKTFAFFGASSKAKYAPIGKKHGSIQGECPYERIFEKRCPILRTCSTGACIHDLNGRKLFNQFLSWWSISSTSV